MTIKVDPLVSWLDLVYPLRYNMGIYVLKDAILEFRLPFTFSNMFASPMR